MDVNYDPKSGENGYSLSESGLSRELVVSGEMMSLIFQVKANYYPHKQVINQLCHYTHAFHLAHLFVHISCGILCTGFECARRAVFSTCKYVYI